MNNQNHSFINALGQVSGNPSNIHILDNMLSFQSAAAADQGHKQLIPQYAYQEMGLAAHHHAMNLVAAPHVTTVASTIDTAALYQSEHAAQQQAQQQQQHQQHQQQPISYKIPQIGGGVTVVTQEQPIQMSISLPDKKRDIVAEALREEKIFEEGNLKKQAQAAAAARAKQQQRQQQAAAAAAAAAQQQRQRQQQHRMTPQLQASAAPVTAVKSEPQPTDDPKPSTSAAAASTSASSEEPKDIKPNIASTSTSKPGPSSTSRPRPYNRVQARTQIMPRLQLLDDEDDGLTCRLCLQAFWYKAQLIDHLKDTHSIADPVKYEREEREKKLRRIREEQQRLAAAKRQRMGAAAYAAQRGMMRGGRGVTVMRGARGGLRPGSMGGRPVPTGPRPSFQYRDGAFICDLCKKSFSDGNDMVSHWKSHVRQQSRLRGSMGHSRGRAKTHLSSRGRPITSKQAGRLNRKGEGRSDKGRARWTSYLLWSTRRRKEITKTNPDYSFAQVGKAISEGWKEVSKEEVDKLKEEAEHLNEHNIRKLPREKRDSESSTTSSESGSGEETDWTASDDPDYDEKAEKKPIMLKIKKDGGPRPARTRKRPSFFQEFENEENNLDKILDDFEQERIEQAKNPGEKKERPKPKNPGSRPRRPKREEEVIEDEGPVELETSRSGRVRKKPKFRQYFDGEEEELLSDDEDKDEYQPEAESEVDEPEEEFVEQVITTDEEDDGSAERDEDGNLPPKKRRRVSKKSGMSRREIEEAMRAAMDARPETVVLVEKKPKKSNEPSDEESKAENASGVKNEASAFQASNSGINEDEPAANADDEDGDNANNPLDDVTLDTPRPAIPLDDDDMDTAKPRSAGDPLEDNALDDDQPADNPLGDNSSQPDDSTQPNNPLEDESNPLEEAENSQEGATSEQATAEETTEVNTEAMEEEPEKSESPTEDPFAAASNEDEAKTKTSEEADGIDNDTPVGGDASEGAQEDADDKQKESANKEDEPMEDEPAKAAEPEAAATSPVEEPEAIEEPEVNKEPEANEELEPVVDAEPEAVQEAVTEPDTDSTAAEPTAQSSAEPAASDAAQPSEEDILTSATERMEEGDEQYKQMIAESQMDNIFN